MARLDGRAGATLWCTWASVLLAVASINQVHMVGAIEAPCTACKAVATELQRRMDNEGVRNHLDLRHRLDKHGKRYGKVIPYKHSEQRAVELLDGLCGAMHDYTLVTVTHNETGKKTIHWAKYQGEGAHQVPKEQRPPSMEEEAHKKRLEVYCGNMMEEYEEQLYEGITKDVFDEKGVEAPLCYKMTNACPKHDVTHKRKPEASGEAPLEASGGAPSGEL